MYWTGHLNVIFRAHIYMMRCIYRFGMYAHHALYIRPPYAIESRWSSTVAARAWDARCAYATYVVDTQWSGSHTRHHTQWHRHSYAICAACASPMRHWYAVETLHMRNSSAGDVPPKHHSDLTAYLFIFPYAVRARWHRRPVEQGHLATQHNSKLQKK